MENLTIRCTIKTPEISFNPAMGLFEITGVSLIENTMEFYHPILHWLEEYIKNPHKTTKFVFKLTYSNTSSFQFIYDMLNLIRSAENTHLVVDWYYASDDLDMKEIGEDYKEASEVDFNFIEVNPKSI